MMRACRVQGSGFRAQGLAVMRACRVQGSDFRVQSSGLGGDEGLQGPGFRVLGFRTQGLGCGSACSVQGVEGMQGLVWEGLPGPGGGRACRPRTYPPSPTPLPSFTLPHHTSTPHTPSAVASELESAKAKARSSSSRLAG